ncbi:protein of unknown function [Cupriavidus taiwanensis]|uniref:YagK/YfjJ C-terminal domain-containing protein n=1 Tax=Cupriavidus taiwanensis TaxID=164546 RepID=A0A375IBF1_9BURK|nr:inovirus-type Gp2 protein [Cupriavidus taiwanensis]SPK70849.1 protein of unknown function [Cupriavidus taiwanensis]
MAEANDALFEDIKHLDTTLNSVRCGDGKVTLVGQYNQSLWQLITFMRAVLERKKKIPFEIRVSKRGKEAIPTSKLAHFFEGLHCYLELHSPDLSYAPHIQLFFDCYYKHPIQYCKQLERNTPFIDGKIQAEWFNDFVAYLRHKGDEIGVRKKVADWERNSKENLKRLDTYVNALFEKYARLMVLRIDLLYKVAVPAKAEMSEANGKLLALPRRDGDARLHETETGRQHARETVARVDIVEAMKDREHLFENMIGKPSLFEHMVGFVWSLEWSRVGGYHLHCAFFFDGSKVHKHEYLADQIGKYWETVITEGRGIYHNCNRDKRKYGDSWAIGPIDHNDDVKRAHLMRTLGYLAKKDQYVYVKPSAKCKRFGTGRMPRSRSGVGRPRKP